MAWTTGNSVAGLASLEQLSKAAGEVITAKQAPHRPGTAPALGLRAGCVVALIVSQTTLATEIPMWFHALINALKPRAARPMPGATRRDTANRRPRSSRLWLEALEDRCLLSNYVVT